MKNDYVDDAGGNNKSSRDDDNDFDGDGYAKTGYPDHFAWKKGHKYFDARSTKDKPVWFMVDLAFEERFAGTVALSTLKEKLFG